MSLSDSCHDSSSIHGIGHIVYRGDWSACWECHLEPDWLLIWDQREDILILVRTPICSG